MKKIIFFTVLGLLCLNFSIMQQIRSQENARLPKQQIELKPLKIGQKIPAKFYQQAMPAMLKQGVVLDSVRLNSYKGKFILLDFWAAWCGSCLNKFAKLDSLQHKYAENVAILLVNTKSTKDNQPTQKAILNGELEPQISSSLVNIYGDTILNQLFPHAYLPHYVWIGKYGELKAISDSSILNEETITALLKEAESIKSKKQ